MKYKYNKKTLEKSLYEEFKKNSIVCCKIDNIEIPDNEDCYLEIEISYHIFYDEFEMLKTFFNDDCMLLSFKNSKGYLSILDKNKDHWIN